MKKMKLFKKSGMKQYLAVVAAFGLIGGAIYVYTSHAQTPSYLVEGYVMRNGSTVAGATVSHYGVPATTYPGFSVTSGAKGWYQYGVKPNTTYFMAAFGKCNSISHTLYQSEWIKFKSGSAGGHLRKDLNLTLKSSCKGL